MFQSNERLPTIPRCACGSDRVFEVQLLPTLLSFVNLEDETLDLAQLKDDKEWSSIFIYTCSNHCDHQEEVVIVLSSFSVS